MDGPDSIKKSMDVVTFSTDKNLIDKWVTIIG